MNFPKIKWRTLIQSIIESNGGIATRDENADLSVPFPWILWGPNIRACEIQASRRCSRLEI